MKFNYMINLTKVRDDLIADKTLFLGMSEGVPDGNSIWIDILSKEECPPKCRWASSFSWLIEEGRKSEFAEFSLELKHPSSPALWYHCYHSPGSKVFRLELGFTLLTLLFLRHSGMNWIVPQDFLVHQFADCGSWEFLVSIIM